MRGVYLPGDRRVEVREVPDPTPGERQLVVRMRASTICGSDLRAIYREHLGRGPEAYRDVIAGHEPAGEVVEIGAGCRRFTVGDRVLVYHISGCGLCADCRSGYMIGCTSPLRAAYRWQRRGGPPDHQRDGGHADYLLADEQTCIALPDELSYLDGATVACSLGTAYEALTRAGTSGRDAVLVVGLGPVGLGAGLLARALGAAPVVGVDVSLERLELARRLGAVDATVSAGDDAADAVLELTAGARCEGTIDCSGGEAGRRTALAPPRRFGRCVLVGEGGGLRLEVSP